MMKLIIATRNENKLLEIKALLEDLDIELLTLHDFPDMPEAAEDRNTFDENALKKARAAAKYTREITLADDSGLEVEFLKGRPGVLSSRFAHKFASDAENNRKLLELLKGVPKEQRSAVFRCSIAIVDKCDRYYLARGSCKGYISDKIRGDKGFGYDPLFVVHEYDKTFAELGSQIKNRISHRTKALTEARKIIKQLYGKKD